MRNKILLSILILALVHSCSKENENIKKEEIKSDNLPPEDFVISVANITDREGSITWNASVDPENSEITYDIYLGDVLVAEKHSELSYTFENLSPDTEYQGRIVASDGVNYTQIDFTLISKPFEPLIFEGFVVLHTQEQVEAFGNIGYNIITSDLRIDSEVNEPSDITDLSPLKDLMEVKGAISIVNNSIQDFNGLNNISVIGSYLRIYKNHSLNNLNGFENLNSIGGSLRINDNQLVENITALKNVHTIDGYITISLNPKVTQIDAFTNLTQIESISIFDNSALQMIDGFTNLTDIKQGLFVSDNPLLIDISGFKNLTDIETLSIYTSQLKDLDVFSNLKTISSTLDLLENNSLENLNGLTLITEIPGNLTIWNNELLSDFCGLRPTAENNGFGDFFSISGNLFNPTKEEIRNGNCSQ